MVGLVIVELELEKEATVTFTLDSFHVEEKFVYGRSQPGLKRDFDAWQRSRAVCCAFGLWSIGGGAGSFSIQC